MSSSRPIRVQVDVENPPTNEDSESAVLDDTYSINSDAAACRTPTPMPAVEDSYSIIHSIAISTVAPAPAQEAPATASRWSRFFGPLCCFSSYRRRKKDQLAEDQCATSCQSEINLHECVEKLEEKVKSCQGRGDAEQLYKELEEMVNCIRSLLGQLRSVMDQLGSGNPDAHRSNLQQVQLTSSASEKLLELLTEKEDEIRALKEEHSKRLQEMRQLEDEKQNQNEQAKLVEIEYHVEMEQNEKLRAENDTLKDQLDSGLVASLDEEDEDIDVLKRKVSGLKARVKDQNDDINKLRDHSKEQSRQVLKYKQQVEVSEVMEKQLETYQGMFHDLKEECGQMHKELMETKENLQQQIQIRDELQNEVAALNEQLTVYKADFDQERQDRAEAHSRMADLEKKGARVKGQIEVERETYHREYRDLKHNFQVLSSQLEQHQLALSAVEEANEKLRQEIQAKASQVKQYAKENDRLKRELEQSRSRNSGRVASPAGSSGVKESKLEDLYRTAQDDIQYLSEENSRHQDRIEELQREIEQLRNVRRISESAVPQVPAPYGKTGVDMYLPGQPLYAEEELHRGERYVHSPISPLTGQKQSQLAPRAVHLMADEVEADGPSPYSKGPPHPQKYPASLAFSPPEQESAAPQQIRPDQLEKVPASVVQADHHASPVYNPLHVAQPPQPMPPQPQVQVTPNSVQREQLVGTASRNDQPFIPHSQLASDTPGGDQVPRQSTEHYREVEDSRQLEDSTAQYENPLQKELDDEIHLQAAEVIQEVSGGRRNVKTDNQRPFDPNLVCPMCRRQFRIGEIQKFRKHVNTCTGTDDV